MSETEKQRNRRKNNPRNSDVLSFAGSTRRFSYKRDYHKRVKDKKSDPSKRLNYDELRIYGTTFIQTDRKSKLQKKQVR